MTEKQVQITPIVSLLDLNGSQTNFSVRGHVQAGGDFNYALATQKQLDDGVVKYSRSQGGYAMVSASSNPGQPYQSYYIAIQSDKPIPAKFWVEQAPQQQRTVPPVHRQLKADAPEKGRNVAPLLWIALLVVIVFMVARRKH